MTSEPASPTPLSLPTTDWEGWLAERCDGQLDQARAHVETLRQGGHDAAAVLALWNDLNLALHNAFASAGLFANVLASSSARAMLPVFCGLMPSPESRRMASWSASPPGPDF